MKEVIVRLTPAQAQMLYVAADQMLDDADDYYGKRHANIFRKAMAVLQEARQKPSRG